MEIPFSSTGFDLEWLVSERTKRTFTLRFVFSHFNIRITVFIVLQGSQFSFLHLFLQWKRTPFSPLSPVKGAASTRNGFLMPNLPWTPARRSTVWPPCWQWRWTPRLCSASAVCLRGLGPCWCWGWPEWSDMLQSMGSQSRIRLRDWTELRFLLGPFSE